MKKIINILIFLLNSDRGKKIFRPATVLALTKGAKNRHPNRCWQSALRERQPGLPRGGLGGGRTETEAVEGRGQGGASSEAGAEPRL